MEYVRVSEKAVLLQGALIFFDQITCLITENLVWWQTDEKAKQYKHASTVQMNDEMGFVIKEWKGNSASFRLTYIFAFLHVSPCRPEVRLRPHVLNMHRHLHPSQTVNDSRGHSFHFKSIKERNLIHRNLNISLNSSSLKRNYDKYDTIGITMSKQKMISIILSITIIFIKYEKKNWLCGFKSDGGGGCVLSKVHGSLTAPRSRVIISLQMAVYPCLCICLSLHD